MSSSSSSVDPVAALGDAWSQARQAFSFSSVRGREETGTHLLRIDGYSTVDSTVEHGKCIDSKPFRAGGHRWKLSYYSNGYTDSNSGRPSVLLRLMEKRIPHLPDITADMTVKATAAYDVSILDVDGNQLYHNAGGQMDYTTGFRGTPASWSDLKETTAAEAPEAERKEALGRLKDDSLVVRCDVTVKRLQEESRIRWLLRRFLD